MTDEKQTSPEASDQTPKEPKPAPSKGYRVVPEQESSAKASERVKLLIDACVAQRVAEELAAEHDVDWVGSWPGTPSDEEVLAAASAGARVLVTLDKDFGELAIAQRRAHAGILRLVDLSVAAFAPTCRAVLARHGRELRAGAIVTASPGRVRIRAPG